MQALCGFHWRFSVGKREQKAVVTGGFSEAGNMWGDISGATAASRAAQRAAEMQAASAAEQRRLILQQSGQNLADLKSREAESMRLAEATPQELSAYTTVLQGAEKQLAQRQRFIDAIDPALMEASKQVLGLLRGESAASLGPLTAQRQSQRQGLVNSLKRQYGSETTSAAQQALRKFDMETDSMMQGAQQSSLNQLYGIAQGGQSFTALPELGAVGGAGAAFGNLQERKRSAYDAYTGRYQNQGQSTLGALSGTAQSMIDTAGASQVGALMRAQTQQGFFNTLVGGGVGYLTAGAGGAAAGKAYAQNQQPGTVSPYGGGAAQPNYGQVGPNRY